MISFLIILFLFLMYAGAYVSAAETALFSLSPSKIKAFKGDRDPTKQLISELLSKSRDLLVTLFMLNTICNILLQNVASAFFGGDASLWLKVGIPLVLTLVFGEIIPKYYGLQNNVSLSMKVAPTISFLKRTLGPIRRFTVYVTTPISRAMFFFLRKEDQLSRDEITEVVKTSEKQGVLTSEESRLIGGFLDLQDIEVKEIMWPREDILSYDITQPLSKLTHLFVEDHCTRLPVIRNSIDDVIGLIDAYTFFMNQPNIKKPEDVLKFIKKPFYVPENTHAKVLLRRLNKEDRELALCVDEYGSITGLITREDLLEVVVGQIVDSRDQDTNYTRQNENEIIAYGKMELLEFNDLFEADLESQEGLVTLGGWLTEQAGDIPKPGYKLEKKGFLFQVLASSPTRVERIYVRKLQGTDG